MTTDEAITEVSDRRPGVEAAPSSLQADPGYQALVRFGHEHRARLLREHRGWDVLWQVQAFARAARFVALGRPLDEDDAHAPSADPAAAAAPVAAADPAALAARFDGPQERRALTHQLLLLMPAELHTRPWGCAFQPLPDAVMARAATGFALVATDLPRLAPVFTRHLRGRSLVDAALRPGQQGEFLVPRHLVPGAPALGERALVRLLDVVVEHGKKLARVQPGDLPPVLVPWQPLVCGLLDVGAGDGLDLDDPDDRALLLTFGHGLRTTSFTTSSGARSLFQWLEEATADVTRRELMALREAVRQAAYLAVVQHAVDPRGASFAFPDDQEWRRRANAALLSTTLMRAAVRRGTWAVEQAWVASLLSWGFAGGLLGPCGLARAFSRLATTVLAPLGLLPFTGLQRGAGAVVLRALALPDDDGLVQVGVPDVVVPARASPGARLRDVEFPPMALDLERVRLFDLAALQDRLAAARAALPEGP